MSASDPLSGQDRAGGPSHGRHTVSRSAGVTERPGSRSLWRHRDFLLLWGGQSVSEMGSAITLLALPLTAVVVLRASTLAGRPAHLGGHLAFALIALPAGAIVDRWAKRWLMIWCDVARMLIIGSVPVAAALGVLTLGQLYAVAVSAGVCTVFFDVSYQSYLPVLIGKDAWSTGTASSARPSRSLRWRGRVWAAAWSARSARPGPWPPTRSPTPSRWRPCSPSGPPRSHRPGPPPKLRAEVLEGL